MKRYNWGERRRDYSRRKKVNKQQFIGRLGQEIELKKTENGTSVIEFSLADTEKYKDKEVTTWLRCVAWSGIADTIAKYVHKGDKVYVEGKYRNEEYTAKDGTKKHRHYMLVAGCELLPNPKLEPKPEPKPAEPDTIGTPYDERYEDFGWF